MNTKTANQAPSGRTVEKPVIKFIIGFVAGWCAACFPRLSALMAGSEGADGLSLFTVEYVILSLVFSVVIGFVVMIMEWHVAREPKATFMMAIGIPALLTGSFNATNGAQTVNDQQATISQLTQELKTTAGISISDDALGSFEVLDIGGSDVQGSADYLQWLGIKSAHAENQPVADQKGIGFNPGYKVMEPLYYISLGNAPNKEMALSMVKQLRTQVNTARAVKTNSGFTILSQLKPMPKSEAVIEAAKLKKQNISASLIPAR